MLIPCLILKKAPKGADTSHKDHQNGYIWYWQSPQGWVFKESEIEAWWSDPMTYVEASQSIRERISPMACMATTFPDVLVIHAPAPYHESRVKIALFRVSRGYLKEFSKEPPSWFKDRPTSWDRLADPLV